MKLCLFSDIHWQTGEFSPEDFPPADACIFAGDWGGVGTIDELCRFLEFFRSLPYSRKILVPGNHDRAILWFPDQARSLIRKSGAELLLDSGTDLGGHRVWGSPWCPEFGDGRWAFLAPEPYLDQKFRMIPDDTEILVTHCPPARILDDFRYGSNALLSRVKGLPSLRLHVFGHVHGSHGELEEDGVRFMNVAVLDDDYEKAWPASIADI